MGRIGPEPDGVEFMPPDGLELRGQEGTAEVKWKRKPNGKICIVSMEGVSLGDGDSEGPQEEDAPDNEAPAYDDSDQ